MHDQKLLFSGKLRDPLASNLILSILIFRYAQSLHYIDSNRIAVTGVSYGAYLATLMLADTGDREHPNPLACGVAVSPVVDWRFYGIFTRCQSPKYENGF